MTTEQPHLCALCGLYGESRCACLGKPPRGGGATGDETPLRQAGDAEDLRLRSHEPSPLKLGGESVDLLKAHGATDAELRLRGIDVLEVEPGRRVGDVEPSLAPRDVAARQRDTYWHLHPLRRGVEIEDYLGRTESLARNFPTIDRFEDGVATSIKSLDLNAQTYQDTAALTRQVKNYVNQMAGYEGQPVPWAGVKIDPHQIKARAVDLAIPAYGGSDAQLVALLQIRDYARGLDVSLNIIRVP